MNIFPDAEHSKPFKSGYDFDNDEEYYVAYLNFNTVQNYYNDVLKPLDDATHIYIDFWIRECVSGLMDISEITIAGTKKKGLFAVIEEKIGLTILPQESPLL